MPEEEPAPGEQEEAGEKPVPAETLERKMVNDAVAYIKALATGTAAMHNGLNRRSARP
jgi:hypothetical protein